MKTYYYLIDDRELVDSPPMPVDHISPDIIGPNYITPPYIIIRVGQNAKENTLLVKSADQNDLWFHLADFASPHVIAFFKESDQDPLLTRHFLYIISDLCKRYSKYSNHPNITVNHLEKRSIKLTKTPGEVVLRKPPRKLVI